ncbi:MAG: hypothetical protein ACRC7N_20400 [Clostridium sp.]
MKKILMGLIFIKTLCFSLTIDDLVYKNEKYYQAINNKIPYTGKIEESEKGLIRHITFKNGVPIFLETFNEEGKKIEVGEFSPEKNIGELKEYKKNNVVITLKIKPNLYEITKTYSDGKTLAEKIVFQNTYKVLSLFLIERYIEVDFTDERNKKAKIEVSKFGVDGVNIEYNLKDIENNLHISIKNGIKQKTNLLKENEVRKIEVFHENGNLKELKEYKDGYLIENIQYDTEGIKTNHIIYKDQKNITLYEERIGREDTFVITEILKDGKRKEVYYYFGTKNVHIHDKLDNEQEYEEYNEIINDKRMEYLYGIKINDSELRESLDSNFEILTKTIAKSNDVYKYYPNGILKKDSKYTYDETGKIILKKEENTVLKEQKKFKYPNGNLLFEEFYTKNLLKETYLEKILNIFSINKNRNLNSEFENKKYYLENGNLIYEKISSKEKYALRSLKNKKIDIIKLNKIMKYDEVGNLIYHEDFKKQKDKIVFTKKSYYSNKKINYSEEIVINTKDIKKITLDEEAEINSWNSHGIEYKILNEVYFPEVYKLKKYNDKEKLEFAIEMKYDEKTGETNSKSEFYNEIGNPKVSFIINYNEKGNFLKNSNYYALISTITYYSNGNIKDKKDLQYLDKNFSESDTKIEKISYFVDGNIEKIEKDNIIKIFYNNGILKEENFLKNTDEITNKYYINGKLSEKKIVSENSLIDSYFFYKNDGELIQEVFKYYKMAYHNKVLEKTLYRYYENGELKDEEIEIEE